MAFVYCNQRWSQKPKQQEPGPGQYSCQESQCHQKPIVNRVRPFSNLKKVKKQKTINQQQYNESIFRQWINSDLLNRKSEERDTDLKKSKVMKGKAFQKSNILIQKQKQICLSPSHNQPDFQIKNAQHSNLSSSKRKKWGNVKIQELLNQQKQFQKKKNGLNKSLSSKILPKSVQYTYQTRLRYQNDLKDLQTLFNSYRGNGSNKLSIQNVHRHISSKQKQRQKNSHTNSYKTVQQRTNQKFPELSRQTLQVCPSRIYKSMGVPTKSKELSKKKYNSIQSTLVQQQKKQKSQNLPTGHSLNEQQEDSMEYIDDSTPGPGSYDINLQALTVKQKTKVQKFGVTMERFKFNEMQMQPQTVIYPRYPQFKKSSLVQQEKVAFGRTTKPQKQNQSDHNGIFYQDPANFQKMAQKIYQKQNQLVGFGSGKKRFDYQNTEYNKQKGYYEQEVPQHNTNHIPTSNFLSKVERVFPINHTTQNVDFKGQNYGCLANKLKKQREFLEDYQIKPAPFLTKQYRFTEQKLSKQQIKVELKVQKIKQLKAKKQKATKKPQKGFTFGKQNFKLQKSFQQQTTPSPNKYANNPGWIKPTHNIRFS